MKPDLLLVRIRRGDITNVSFDDLVRLVREQVIAAWLDAARATDRPILKPSSRATLA